MSIFDRGSLQSSPLADLHEIAAELSIDSFRRLRKAQLVDAILERQGGEPAAAGQEEPTEADREDTAEPGEEQTAEAGPEDESPSPRRRRRGGRGGRGRSTARDEADPSEEAESVAGGAAADAEETVEGVVEVLPGGSGFVRVNPPDPSDDDVYISAAQVRRCELVSGDRVSGPRRPPRRSERFASLVRVETVNGKPAGELADSVRFEDLPAEFPRQRLALSGDDPALAAVLAAVPLGRGSRVVITGQRQSGKTDLLRRLAAGLAGDAGSGVWLVLAGIRPEEIAEWRAGPLEPTAAVAFGASLDAQSQTVEAVVEQARRLVTRGDHAVVLIDTLDAVHEPVARKALGSARYIPGGGSLTVIATASAPVGAETALITLDGERSRADGSPVLDATASWVLRAELLEQ